MEDEMDEIWALYADDGQQALDAMETALDALAGCDKSAEESHISALFRAVHTFKGNSRVLGLAVVESRAHLAEDLIGLVRDQGCRWMRRSATSCCWPPMCCAACWRKPHRPAPM
ncbi:Hpt domain-containing protein [Gemmobacter lanyuensis]